MIHAIIIDDEIKSGELTALKLKKFCPEIQVLQVFNDSTKALLWLFDNTPDIIFLDIEMPGINGLQIAEKIANKTDIVFITAHQQYSIEAIRLTAFDYLLKPIDETDLKNCVDRYIEKQIKAKPNNLKSNNTNFDKIALPSAEGIHFMAINTIIYVEAESNYSIFHFIDRKKMIISKTLKQVEQALEMYSFFRAHKSNLLNLNYIQKYIKGEGGTIVMKDGSEIELSRNKKSDFLMLFEKM